MRFSVASWVPIPTSLPNEFLFENYFKLYEKAKQIGDSKLSATAKALKYALVLRLCWSHFDVGDNLGSSHYVYDLTQICHQHLLQPTSATNIDVATLYLSSWNFELFYQIIFRHQEKIDKQQRAVKEIQITFGFNDSDNTVGWKRYENAMTMYYLHPTQKFIQEEHSFPLVPGLERV